MPYLTVHGQNRNTYLIAQTTNLRPPECSFFFKKKESWVLDAQIMQMLTPLSHSLSYHITNHIYHPLSVQVFFFSDKIVTTYTLCTILMIHNCW